MRLGDDVAVDEVSAAVGLFGREDALRVVTDLLIQGGSAVGMWVCGRSRGV